MPKELPKYCRKCGKELIQSEQNASSLREWHYDSGGGSFWMIDSAFNEKSGKENIVTILQCPAYEKRFFRCNSHDRRAFYQDEEKYI